MLCLRVEIWYERKFLRASKARGIVGSLGSVRWLWLADFRDSKALSPITDSKSR